VQDKTVKNQICSLNVDYVCRTRLTVARFVDRHIFTAADNLLRHP